MSTDPQELNPQSLSILMGRSLYRIDTPARNNTAVLTEQKKKPEQPLHLPVPPSLNAPRVVVVVVVRTALIEEETAYALLTTILSACKLTMDQIQLISPFSFDLTAAGLQKQHSPSHVILFGIGSSEIGLSVYFPDYQLQIVEGVQYLTAPDLALMENDKPAKQKLWLSLKTAFSI